MKHLIIALLICSSTYVFASNATNFPADTTQIANENVLYKVTQDGSYVHLNVSTSDTKTAMSILRSGLTIYYDIKGKKKKDVFIKYPYDAGSGSPRQAPQENIDATAIDLNSMIEKLPAEAEYSYFEETQMFNKDLNSLDITIQSKYTASNQLFEFLIKIPKTKIASKANSDFSKLSIGVVGNKKEGDSTQQRGQGQSQGMRGGGGRRGGGGGGRGGNRGQNEQRSDQSTGKVSIDFWFDTE